MFEAEKLKDYDPNKFHPGYVSIKRNGIHGIYSRQHGIFSRTPGQIKGLEHLHEPLHRCPFPLVFEIVIPNLDFETASGLIRNFEPVPNAELYIFNMVHPTMTFKERKRQLDRYQEIVLQDHPKIRVEPMYLVENKDEFDIFYNEAVDSGEEGACWISPSHIYSPGKRRWLWMKRVPLRSIEVEVIDILPGTKGKKYESSLGRMLCRMDNGNEVKVGIFKGQTDAWRQKIYDTKDEYIGQYITIVFKNYSKYGIPVQPRFVGFRWDI